MDVKLVLVLVLLALAGTLVEADFGYNRVNPKPSELTKLGLKCVPGHTVMKVVQNKKPLIAKTSDESSSESRRTHMNSGIKEEQCLICVCNLRGTEEYCSGRPARNVNECIRMATLDKQMYEGLPYSHDRALSYRIRRDYIWHYDEIPYEATAKCKRGTSYYSNDPDANNTDIYVASDIESLLSYDNQTFCYYCVCSVHGRGVGCISRDPWYCEYYRVIRNPQAASDRYKKLFWQERPTYFRTLSFRMRRRMDDGVYALLDIVNSGSKDAKCVPFVSEYTDCSDENMCSGCNRCTCDQDGNWVCKKVVQCPTDDEEDPDEVSIDVTLDSLLDELRLKQKNTQQFVPEPPRSDNDLLLENNKFEDYMSYLRRKRSVDADQTSNHTIKFYNTVNEINEDTLKHSNKTGTIEAHKFTPQVVSKISRRTTYKENNSKSGLNSLHIESNQGDEYNHHSTENKIDSAEHKKVELDKKLSNILGNYTQDKKDTDISKLVVNELKTGIEIIGEKGVNPVSNITFTPENDTLTAMAFIAGNLLNKLWDMEKYAGYGSIEADMLKHEKINDLLELFKEPLSIRQETFLKNALEKLAQTLDTNKDPRNMTICENFEEKDATTHSTNKISTDKATSEEAKMRKDSPTNVTSEALSKLSNVLNLINDFEKVQKDLNVIKEKLRDSKLLNDTNFKSSGTTHIFGNVLAKISKLLIPSNYKNTKDKTRNLVRMGERSDTRNISLGNFNINFNEMNLTAKDKIVLDYIKHIEDNPSCLYQKKLQSEANKSLLKIEGSILYNLSEFLKMKSYDDLMKSYKPDVRQDVQKKITTTTEKLNVKAIPTEKISPLKEESKLQIAKEKLKIHLKAIIDDLIELQSEDTADSDIKRNSIAQALPCIYNILKDNQLTPNKKPDKTSSLKKIKSMIESLKTDFQSNRATRRRYTPSQQSESTKVWERVIKNIERLHKQKTRRNLNEIKPKSFDQISELIKKVNKLGNYYKDIALLSDVSPKNRLMLLKALEADAKQQENILKNIKLSSEIIYNLPIEKQMEINKFVENSKRSIDLSDKVFKNVLYSNAQNKPDLVEQFKVKDKENNSNLNIKKPNLNDLLFPNYVNEPLVDSNFKVTRDQIINQLMVNRVNAYLKMKEATESDPSEDIKYNVAVNILSLMRSGNTALSKELFKFFLTKKDREVIENVENVDQDEPGVQSPVRKGPLVLALKDPIITVKGAKDARLQAQDNLLKQLMNLESMNK